MHLETPQLFVQVIQAEILGLSSPAEQGPVPISSMHQPKHKACRLLLEKHHPVRAGQAQRHPVVTEVVQDVNKQASLS